MRSRQLIGAGAPDDVSPVSSAFWASQPASRAVAVTAIHSASAWADLELAFMGILQGCRGAFVAGS